MQAYIENKMNKEVKHIINMQFLLNEYDRENKNLNKQIIDLLSENKQLKISKIKNNIFKRDVPRIFQKIEPRGSSKRITAIDFKQECKNKYHQTSTVSKKSIKDEFIETTIKKPNSKGQVVFAKSSDKVQNQNNISKIPYLQEKDIQTFSFRGDSNTQSNLEVLQESENLQYIKQTSKKHENQDISQKSNLFKKTVIQNSSYLSPNSKLNGSLQTIQLKTEAKNDQSSKLSNKKRDGLQSPKSQHHRSHHAINPSPQITPYKSEKSLLKHANASFSNLAKSRQSVKKHQYDSMQKRKKFIQMTSLKINPLRMRTEGCC